MTTGDYSTKELLQQEEELALSSVTNEDAIGLGQELLKLALSQKAPVIVQVRIGEQIIFHSALTGSSSENDWWINRKYRVVEKFKHSSMYVRVYFEEKNRQIDEKIAILQGFIDAVHQLRKAEDIDDSVVKVKELQKDWKTIIGLPPKKQSMLWKNFKKANDMFFEKYNRIKGIDYKPRVDPRVQELNTMTGELEIKLGDQDNMVATAELAKAYLVKWKEVTAQIKTIDRSMAERFRNACDKIFEMNYLLRVISYRHANLNEKPRLEQLKIMINQMDYMTKKEKGELDDFIAQAERDRQMEDKPIQSKINTQKRKISMKEMLLANFKTELDTILNN